MESAATAGTEQVIPLCASRPLVPITLQEKTAGTSGHFVAAQGESYQNLRACKAKKSVDV